MTATVTVLPLRVCPLPGASIVISVPILVGVGVAAGVLLGLGFGVGVCVGTGVGVRAGDGVAVGVGLGVGVGLATCSERASNCGRPSIQAWAGAAVDRNANSIAVAPKGRATNPKKPFISLPPNKKFEADAVLRRSAALVLSAMRPTGRSCRSRTRDGYAR